MARKSMNIMHALSVSAFSPLLYSTPFRCASTMLRCNGMSTRISFSLTHKNGPDDIFKAMIPPRTAITHQGKEMGFTFCPPEKMTNQIGIKRCLVHGFFSPTLKRVIYDNILAYPRNIKHPSLPLSATECTENSINIARLLTFNIANHRVLACHQKRNSGLFCSETFADGISS